VAYGECFGDDWVLGVVVSGALLIGRGTTVALMVPYWIGYPLPVHWPAPPEPAPQGGWTGVSRLASSFERADADPAVYTRMIEPRLHELIDERVREAGISTGDQRVRDLHARVSQVGHRSPRSAGSVRARAATDVVSVLDDLGELTDLDELTNKEGSR
jgi:hypothetical protein